MCTELEKLENDLEKILIQTVQEWEQKNNVRITGVVVDRIPYDGYRIRSFVAIDTASLFKKEASEIV